MLILFLAHGIHELKKLCTLQKYGKQYSTVLEILHKPLQNKGYLDGLKKNRKQMGYVMKMDVGQVAFM